MMIVWGNYKSGWEGGRMETTPSAEEEEKERRNEEKKDAETVWANGRWRGPVLLVGFDRRLQGIVRLPTRLAKI